MQRDDTMETPEPPRVSKTRPDGLTGSPASSPTPSRRHSKLLSREDSSGGWSEPPSPNPEVKASYDFRDERETQHSDSKYYAHQRGLSTKLSSTALGGLSRPRAEADAPLANGELPHGSPVFDKHVENEDAIDEGFTAASPGEHLSAELQSLFTAFQSCLDLRDKYIRLSRQRLEDNPQNYDGRFAPPPGTTSTSSARPDWDGTQSPASPAFAPWKIYPAHTPRHWQKRDPAAPPDHAWTDKPPPAQNPFHFEECEIPGRHPYEFRLDARGVFQVYEGKGKEKETERPLYEIPTLKQYYMDLEHVLAVISDGPTKSFAWRRLRYLESKWNMYVLLNEYQELADMKRIPHRDFYNVRKVDTHVHHSACFNQKHLLRFIKSKMKRAPDDTVIFRDGKHLTLRQVFESLNLTAYDLSIDTLDMHAHDTVFHRFDKFNTKYNPIGESRLREIFLKTDNLIEGRYLAELTQEVFEDLQQSKYQMAEYRISIYGRSLDEWDKLARWIVRNKLFSDNVRWLIQFPRLYDVYKKAGTVATFEEIIRNIFQPLFEVTQDPTTHPELHVFLQRVIGFDSVDDESKAEKRLYRKFPFPNDWSTTQNPPYNYWLYYLFANMASLNNWRHERGFNTFVLRPHAGEAGDTDHLTAAYLTSHSISHGILLRKVPALQYLFYLQQIGIAMSPLSNNALFLAFERNPFPTYFRTGLNVSLSTDDPLMFAFTREPLLEEYSIAAQIYRLSPADMSEIAMHSVRQSGFEMEVKRHWLGQSWYLPGVKGNTIDQTNVPDVRVRYRHSTLTEERAMIRRCCADPKLANGSSGNADAGIVAGAAAAADTGLNGGAPAGMPVLPGVSAISDRQKKAST